MLVTGSFDASVGIWRRWDNGGMNPKPIEAEEISSADNEFDMTNGVNGGHSHENDDEDDDEEWRFAVVLDGHESEVKSVAWSAGGNFLATCSRDKSVWIWEEMEDDNFETIAVLQEHDGDVKCVVWHPEEELLASASYDDTIRLYREDLDDWTCASILKGHESTVWSVDFEPVNNSSLDASDEPTEDVVAWRRTREASGPRLISSSDDQTIRVWRRKPRENAAQNSGQPRMPSVIRTDSIEEHWIQESSLPRRHERAIYSVAWSRRTGRVVSTGGDGKLVVYEERWRKPRNRSSATEGNGDSGDMEGIETENDKHPCATEWVTLAEIEGAHGVFEINHVCWARRADKGKRSDDEEVIVSTGDDGMARVWTLDLR